MDFFFENWLVSVRFLIYFSSFDSPDSSESDFSFCSLNLCLIWIPSVIFLFFNMWNVSHLFHSLFITIISFLILFPPSNYFKKKYNDDPFWFSVSLLRTLIESITYRYTQIYNITCTHTNTVTHVLNTYFNAFLDILIQFSKFLFLSSPLSKTLFTFISRKGGDTTTADWTSRLTIINKRIKKQKMKEKKKSKREKS